MTAIAMAGGIISTGCLLIHLSHSYERDIFETPLGNLFMFNSDQIMVVRYHRSGSLA